MLATFLKGATAAQVVSVTYITGANVTTSGTTFTFSNLSIGAASSTRRVVVVVYANGSSVTDISSITIGGSAATIDVKTTAISNGPLAIASRAIASGTTATVVVSTTGTAARCRVEVYSCVGSILTPVVANSNSNRVASGTSVNTSISVVNGQAAIAGVGMVGTGASSQTITFSSLTKDSQNSTGSTVRNMAVASSQNLSTGTLTETASISSSFEMGIVLAAYE